MANDTFLDAESATALLNSVISELPDLPSYAPFQDGWHLVKLNVLTKEVELKKGKTIGVEFKLTLIGTLESYAEGDKKDEEGAMCSETALMHNDFGAGKVKLLFSNLASVLGVQDKSVQEIMDMIEDLEVVVLTSHRTNREDKTKQYLDIKEFMLDTEYEAMEAKKAG